MRSQNKTVQNEHVILRRVSRIQVDDTFLGDVSQVELIDTDGDVVASAGDRVFTKTPGKGLYIAFKYSIAEMEVTEEDGTL